MSEFKAVNNDEIKEILEDNGELIVRYKDNSFECFDTLPKNVVDYITNLQGRFDALLEAHKIADELETEFQERNEKAIEIYKNRNTCKYKKERFMEDKSTSDLMYEVLTGGDKNVKD